MQSNIFILKYSEKLKNYQEIFTFQASYHVNFDNEFFQEYVADET
jgi:hypothetical protein